MKFPVLLNFKWTLYFKKGRLLFLRPSPLLISNGEKRRLWERDWFEIQKSYSYSNLKLSNIYGILWQCSIFHKSLVTLPWFCTWGLHQDLDSCLRSIQVSCLHQYIPEAQFSNLLYLKLKNSQNITRIPIG